MMTSDLQFQIQVTPTQMNQNGSEFVEDIYSFGVDTREELRINVSLRFQNQSEEAWEYTGLQLDELYEKLSSLTDLERLNFAIREEAWMRVRSKYTFSDYFGLWPPVKISYIKIPPLQSVSEVIILSPGRRRRQDSVPSPYVPIGWLSLLSGDLKQLPNLTSLEIGLHTWQEGISNEEIIQFGKTLRELKNLTLLKLRFNGLKFSDEALIELFGGISQLTQITSLDLLLDMTEVSLGSLTLFERLSNLPNLEILSLTLIGVSADKLSKFSHVLPTYTAVTSLELIFQDWDAPEPTMKELATGIATLTGLTSVVLDFPPRKTTVAGAGYLVESVHNLPNIQSFKLKAEAYDFWTLRAEISIPRNINELSIEYYMDLSYNGKRDSATFYQNLPNLKNLKRFSVNRKGDPYYQRESDTTPAALVDSLSKMTYLEELQIHIYAEEPGLIKLAKALSSLKQLKSLDATFYAYKASSVLGYLSNSISTLSELTSVKIALNPTEKYSNDDLVSLSKSLKKLKLQKLELEFVECLYAMDDEGFGIFIEDLSSQATLESLDLRFGACYFFGDESLEKLSVILSNLSAIALDLTCTSVSNEGLESFGSELINLHNLRSLQLDFTSCPKLSDTQFEIFNRTILENLNLQTFTLNEFRKFAPKSSRAFPEACHFAISTPGGQYYKRTRAIEKVLSPMVLFGIQLLVCCAFIYCLCLRKVARKPEEEPLVGSGPPQPQAC